MKNPTKMSKKYIENEIFNCTSHKTKKKKKKKKRKKEEEQNVTQLVNYYF